jgi:hypothetical protein
MPCRSSRSAAILEIKLKSDASLMNMMWLRSAVRMCGLKEAFLSRDQPHAVAVALQPKAVVFDFAEPFRADRDAG